MDLVIKNAHIINPLTDLNQVADILVKDSIICEIVPDIKVPEGYVKIDASGLLAMPGLCDIHVHFRDPGWPDKETIESGSRAALAGGVTTVVNMANTNPVVDNVDTMSYIMKKAAESPITVLQNSAITVGLGGKEIVDTDAQLSAGACGFSDDGIPIVDVGVMKKAMSEVIRQGKILSLHEELPSLLFSQGVNCGEVSEKIGVGGAPGISESAIIERDLLLQKQLGGHLHFQHISAARSVDLIRAAKQSGQKVTCEVTPQHLTLTEQVVLDEGTNGRINPPIRTESDRQALLAGIADGTIDCIVTDHAPHTSEEKSKPFAQAPSGLIGLETSLAVAYNTLVRGGIIGASRLVELMSVTPAAMYGIKKSIEVGQPADLILFDPEQQYMYTDTVSKSSNSPFLGKMLTGKVKYTICKGKIHTIV